MTANAIDLTTVVNVKQWLSIPTGDATQDQNIQGAITAFSNYVLNQTGRGNFDGSVPATSPFVEPVAYDDFYDGSGTLRQPIRNWPIVSVASVNVSGSPIPQSTSVNVWGWVIDADRKFVSVRGGYSPTVATFQNYRYQNQGAGYAFQGPGFTSGVQNVEIQYTAGYAGTPFDLEMMARRVVARDYKGIQWIGQRAQAMAAGAGTTSYTTWSLDPRDLEVLRYYRAYRS